MFSVKETDLTVIPISSPLYPDRLRGVSDAPETLYALGDVSLLNSRTFTMVGSRRTPMYALKSCLRTAFWQKEFNAPPLVGHNIAP